MTDEHLISTSVSEIGTYSRIYVFTYLRIYVFMYSCLHVTCKCLPTPTTHMYIYTFMSASTNIPILISHQHTYSYTPIHKYPHIHTHKHTYTYTYRYLNCPHISESEWHPFTISSAQDDMINGPRIHIDSGEEVMEVPRPNNLHPNAKWNKYCLLSQNWKELNPNE